MATRYHIGAKQLRGGLGAYAKRFDFLEVVVTSGTGSTVSAPKPNPSQATLRKWRKEVPPHFNFCVVAGPHLSSLKGSDALEQELSAACTAVAALQARCVLLRTPPEVTPSQVWRTRLQAVVERLPHDPTHIVWEPTGLWEVDEAAVVAKRLGVLLAVDPARDPVPRGPVAYARLRALGETRSFGVSALEKIVRSIGNRRDVFMILETTSALSEAKRLRQIVEVAKSDGGGGMSRLVRPRDSLLVRDDEQE